MGNAKTLAFFRKNKFDFPFLFIFANKVSDFNASVQQVKNFPINLGWQLIDSCFFVA
jgi:hypothetical protein